MISPLNHYLKAIDAAGRTKPIERDLRIRVVADGLGLGQDGDAVIKLSGFFRSSRRGPPYEDIDPFADAIVKNFGVARCVWGSDWPFLGVSPRPSYEATLAPLARWLSAPSDLKPVLWDNPRRLFGFAKESP